MSPSLWFIFGQPWDSRKTAQNTLHWFSNHVRCFCGSMSCKSKYCWSTALVYGGIFRTSKNSYAILPLEVTHGPWQEFERELSNQSWSYDWSHALLGSQDKPRNLESVAQPSTRIAIPWWNGLRGRFHCSRRRSKRRPGNTQRKRIHLAWRQGTEPQSQKKRSRMYTHPSEFLPNPKTEPESAG